jgi:hypothetical protein
MRVPAEDIRNVQTDVDGIRYTARNGFFEMPERDARAYLQSANMPWPNIVGATRRRIGYRCGACGFGSFFRICSRCGNPCEKE